MKTYQTSVHIFILFSSLLSCLPPTNAQNLSFATQRAMMKKGSPEKCQTVASDYITCHLASKKKTTFCNKEFVTKWKNGKHTDGYDCRRLFHSKGIVFLAKACETAHLDISKCKDLNAVLFKSDPPFVACPRDVRICPDGTSVIRDPTNDCKFEPCCCDPEEEPMCKDGSRCCADGTWSCDIGNGKFPCDVENSKEPSYDGPFGEVCSVFCTADAKICPDGSTVGRDPENDCEFFPCTVFCTADAKICPDGSAVGRDPENDCEFFPCRTPKRKCYSVDDCVLYSNYCAHCLCEALHVNDPRPVCTSPSPCVVDPCMDKKVKCYNEECVLE